jgi:hypothetical protein
LNENELIQTNSHSTHKSFARWHLRVSYHLLFLFSSNLSCICYTTEKGEKAKQQTTFLPLMLFARRKDDCAHGARHANRLPLFRCEQDLLRLLLHPLLVREEDRRRDAISTANCIVSVCTRRRAQLGQKGAYNKFVYAFACNRGSVQFSTEHHPP